MKLLNKMKLRTPTASISNDDKLLQEKLKRNSKKIQSAQDALAKGSKDSTLLQRRIIKLQAKESALICMQNLKQRFMISVPEHYDEHTDIGAEKKKVYQNIQNVTNELYASLEEKMDATESMTIAMATQTMGENQSILKALLTMVSDELIPMAYDGVALKGYYELKRNLQDLIEKSQIAQKALASSLALGSVDSVNDIVTDSTLLSVEQLDALQMVCKATKLRLSSLSSLLELSIAGRSQRVDAEGNITEDGEKISIALKQNLRELLNATDLSSMQLGNNEALIETMPFLQELDIGELVLPLQREGFDYAKEMLETGIGSRLGQNILEIVEVEVEKQREPYVNPETGDIEEGEAEIEIVKELQCRPFKHCESTDDVIEVIEKLAQVVSYNGRPAVDMHNVCALLVQKLKDEINLGQRGGFSLEKMKRYTYYKVGEQLDREEKPGVIKSNIGLVGTKSEAMLHYIKGGKDFIYNVRDNYLLGITRTADAFSALLQSVGNKAELNKLLSHTIQTAETNSLGEEQSAPQAEASPIQEEHIAPTKKTLKERDIKTAGEFFKGYVDKITKSLETGMEKESIIKYLGTPDKQSFFIDFINSESLPEYLHQHSKDIMQKGLPLLAEWLFNLPEDSISQDKKETVITALVMMAGMTIHNISPELQQYVTGVQKSGEENISIPRPYRTEKEFQEMKEEYRQKLRSQTAFKALAEQEHVLGLLSIQAGLKKVWDEMLVRSRS